MTMFEFGRELRRILGQNVLGLSARSDPDTSLYELMNLEMLIAQGHSLDAEISRVSNRNTLELCLESALIWREYARRTGDALAVRKATTAAEKAGSAAISGMDAARAARVQADICLLSYDLFETADLLGSAESLLAQARAAVDPNHHHALDAAFTLTEARLIARLALRKGMGSDLDPALEAMAHIDRAVEKYDHLVRISGATRDKIEAANARIERCDLLALVGIDRQDSRLLKAVIKELEALKVRFDPQFEPLTSARITQRLALVQAHLGQIDGAPALVAEALSVLGLKTDLLPYEHSPMDWLTHKQTMATSLQVLAELSGEDRLSDQALSLYDLALSKPLQKGLSLRAELTNNRAACVTRRAELKGDLMALDAAETAFKTELQITNPNEDPVGWAILQANLGRLYVSRSDLTGFMPGRTEITYALEAARDIFEEFGLKSLLGLTDHNLMRIRQA
ncbi:MAG: hypothetical protein QM645_00865 [Asticcacaulis sp.]